ncbi:nitrogen regulation protein NR(II) [Psychromonas sp. Urea-02u-13]|uniref:nitrogen regulation protein NR(II) n=1 Tax=Psychromonas sp. Urea-02u-13 TaxID=2058326 RepID=UPI000C32933F|nr:nitrogen regulation protein NR(II) [Psychromonas sp. Urea-02u-13]PKG40859.1 nitrogen regulation protein NR(II) [Psychromonas sp. Urea-02u-13]
MLEHLPTDFPLAIIEEAHTAFVIIDESLNLTYANPASELLLSQSSQRLHQQSLQQLANYYHFNPIAIEQVFKNKGAFSESEITLLVETQPVLISLSASHLLYQENAYVIIEMRGIEQQRKISQVHYQEHQQKAAQDLVRGLAHEIKNPLGGLRGAAQLLEGELPSPELKEFTQIIIEQADRLSALVNRLLGPQKIGQWKTDNIHSVIEKVRKLVCLDLPDFINIKLDYDPSIPDFEMQSDQLQQAFLNVLQNAVQALIPDLKQNAEITLRTRTAHQVTINGLPQRLAVEIKIIDNGSGIPNHLKDTLFYPMVTGKSDGTGLGLSIAQELIKQHHGRIECHSIAGHTEFSIYLPMIL